MNNQEQNIIHIKDNLLDVKSTNDDINQDLMNEKRIIVQNEEKVNCLENINQQDYK